MHTFSETTGTGVPAFLAKLWRLVEDPTTDNLISWSPDGGSFIIQNQAQFARDLLPLNYKHNNMASFIRQLNMYGFHKITSIDNGGLKFDRDEMEFSHSFFQRGYPYLLEHIKRKIANPKQTDEKGVYKPEAVNKVLNEVQLMRGRQDSLDTRFSSMKQENEALWKEIAMLRQKHMKQQQMVNKLIQFLVTIVQPQCSNLGGGMVGVKRRIQLMINDAPQDAKMRRTNDDDSSGPVIRELGEELLDDIRDSDSEIVMTPTVQPFKKSTNDNSETRKAPPSSSTSIPSSTKKIPSFGKRMMLLKQQQEQQNFDDEEDDDEDVDEDYDVEEQEIKMEQEQQQTYNQINNAIDAHDGCYDHDDDVNIDIDENDYNYIEEMSSKQLNNAQNNYIDNIIINKQNNDIDDDNDDADDVVGDDDDSHCLTTPLVKKEMERRNKKKRKNKRSLLNQKSINNKINTSNSNQLQINNNNNNKFIKTNNTTNTLNNNNNSTITTAVTKNSKSILKKKQQQEQQQQQKLIKSEKKDADELRNLNVKSLAVSGGTNNQLNTITTTTGVGNVSTQSSTANKTPMYINQVDFINAEMPNELFDDESDIIINNLSNKESPLIGGIQLEGTSFNNNNNNNKNNSQKQQQEQQQKNIRTITSSGKRILNDNNGEGGSGITTTGGNTTNSTTAKTTTTVNPVRNDWALSKMNKNNELLKLTTPADIDQHLENFQGELDSLKDLLRGDYVVDSHNETNGGKTPKLIQSPYIDFDHFVKLFADSDVLSPYNMQVPEKKYDDPINSSSGYGSELMAYNPQTSVDLFDMFNDSNCEDGGGVGINQDICDINEVPPKTPGSDVLNTPYYDKEITFKTK